MTKPRKTDEPALKGRLLTSMQSTGRVGKSTMSEAVLSWLTYAGVPWQAVDCDAEHKTLSARFPERVRFFPVEDNDKLLALFNYAGSAPVELIDFPAQATQFLLEGMERFRVLDILEEKGIRLTAFLYAADDATAESSLARIVRAFGERADYLVVKNPARFRSEKFEASKAAQLLAEKGSPVIELPALTTTTLKELSEAAAKEKRWLPMTDALPHLTTGPRMETEFFLNRVFAQCEDAAGVLLPDMKLLQKRVERPQEKASGPAFNEFDPLNSL